MIQIRTETQQHLGYIPYDKISRFGMQFEEAGLGFWIGDKPSDTLKDAVKSAVKGLGTAMTDQNLKLAKEVLKSARNTVKDLLRSSDRFKEAERRGHSMFYLNFNHDGIDCFISRDGN